MKMLPVTHGVADAEAIEFGKRRELKEALRMGYRKASRDDISQRKCSRLLPRTWDRVHASKE
jgi:hypothetical protein